MWGSWSKCLFYLSIEVMPDPNYHKRIIDRRDQSPLGCSVLVTKSSSPLAYEYLICHYGRFWTYFTLFSLFFKSSLLLLHTVDRARFAFRHMIASDCFLNPSWFQFEAVTRIYIFVNPLLPLHSTLFFKYTLISEPLNLSTSVILILLSIYRAR